MKVAILICAVLISAQFTPVLATPAAKGDQPRAVPSKNLEVRRNVQSLIRSGKRGQAMRIANRQINNQPLSGEGHFNKGRILDSEDNFEEALKCYSEACKLEPAVEQFWYFRGQSALANDQLALAEECFKKSSQLDPKNRMTYVLLGQMYMEQKKYGQAAENYKKDLALEPRDDRTSFRLAESYKAAKQWQNAASVYSNLVRRFPDDEQARRMRGDCYVELGSWKLAIDDYTAAINLDPDDASSIYKGRANAYKKLGDLKSAQADLKRFESSMSNSGAHK